MPSNIPAANTAPSAPPYPKEGFTSPPQNGSYLPRYPTKYDQNPLDQQPTQSSQYDPEQSDDSVPSAEKKSPFANQPVQNLETTVYAYALGVISSATAYYFYSSVKERTRKNTEQTPEPEIQPLSSRNFDGTTDSWLATANIYRATMGVLATAAAVSPYFLAGIINPPVAIVGAAVTAGGLLLGATQIRNYDSGAEVARYRKECDSLPLQEAFRTHGRYVLARKLLSPDRIRDKYLAEQQEISTVPALKSHYFEIAKHLGSNGPTLPHPIETSRERISRDCSRLRLEEAVSLHGFESIFSWELYSPDEFQTKYEERERRLGGLQKIQEFHRSAEYALKQSGLEYKYTIPRPERLEARIREQCARLSLQEIVNLHSKECLFSSNLLSPRQFSEKYQEHADALFGRSGINSVIASYKETVALRDKTPSNGVHYEVPPPSVFARAWEESTRNLSLQTLLREYNLDDLINYGIVRDPSYIRSLRDLKRATSLLETRKQQALYKSDLQYREEKTKANEALEQILHTSEIGKKALSALREEQEKSIRLLGEEHRFASATGDLIRAGEILQKIESKERSNFIENLDTEKQEKSIDATIRSARESFREKIEYLEGRKYNTLRTIENDYQEGLIGLEKQHRIAVENRDLRNW